MSDNKQPDIGKDIIRYHKIMTRGINTSNKHINESLKNRSLDPSSRGGFLNYVQTLLTILKAHHMAEDQVIFPYVRDIFPEVPYERLIEEHEVISTELNSINKAILDLNSENDELTFLNKIKASMSVIAGLWPPHIEIEESMVYEKIGYKLDPEENNRLRMEFIQFYMKHVSPDYLIVPFSVYNLESEDRVAMEQNLPEEVKTKLLPIDWKDKWAPMQPFLLE